MSSQPKWRDPFVWGKGFFSAGWRIGMTNCFNIAILFILPKIESITIIQKEPGTIRGMLI
ncbi:hypothetical protein CO015_04115 [candidate division WWE3 bacterium CG_4_8_14_3_um_filter_42_11]|uniref:Uncharacterized protein n=2 Tax=Katanobacteria TaxID=422282 RepID=A0A2M7TER9_UNCKA|nr:MAG: hypothetical protein COY34_00310 [candidate division WWE3 bacterium CG_4_10_14_0_2_um_filter_42_8]PJC68410.1 MAG: hypothetical protein CO015_04115 [candidate division WWE3 bacterium CG_4_8_14_3_um_filter_42_11]